MENLVVAVEEQRQSSFPRAMAACYGHAMKTLQVELPDEIARDVEGAVRSGVFRDAAEVVRAALREFISTRRFELQEQQQLQDIAWALREDSNQK
jgi:Arc/MetJ-type ribon-helix-helix transcriptional regulator